MSIIITLFNYCFSLRTFLYANIISAQQTLNERQRRTGKWVEREEGLKGALTRRVSYWPGLTPSVAATCLAQWWVQSARPPLFMLAKHFFFSECITEGGLKKYEFQRLYFLEWFLVNFLTVLFRKIGSRQIGRVWQKMKGYIIYFNPQKSTVLFLPLACFPSRYLAQNASH